MSRGVNWDEHVLDLFVCFIVFYGHLLYAYFMKIQHKMDLEPVVASSHN